MEMKLRTYITTEGSKKIGYGHMLLQHKNRNVKIRKATIWDLRSVFLLSNDTEVRINSINENTILWDSHIKWFTRKINTSDCYYYVAYEDDDFVGQVRYDIENTVAMVGISITNTYRKRGIATKLLKDTARELFQKQTKIHIITALIKPINIASLKLFEGVGYLYKSKTMEANEEYCVYQLFQENIRETRWQNNE